MSMKQWDRNVGDTFSGGVTDLSGKSANKMGILPSFYK